MATKNRPTPAGALPDARANSRPEVPPPRRIRHFRTLLWWLGLCIAVLALQGQSVRQPNAQAFAVPDAARTEHDAFIAFVFGKVNADDPDAIDPRVLRAQLENLKASGAQPVRLEDVRLFMEQQRPLPEKPVLLAFDEARRVTIDAVEPILEDLGMTAVTFVSVDEVKAGNVDLVSRRRLGRMSASGHWDIGISACQIPTAGKTQEAVKPSVAVSGQWRDMLEDWTDGPVLAASCLSGWHKMPDSRQRWESTLHAAALPLGFVTRPPGMNHRDDRASALRLIRVPARDRRADSLVHYASAYIPRRERFVDDFDGNKLARAWLADEDWIRVEGGMLHLTAQTNDWGGTATLGGTDRWRDVNVEVELAGLPTGQFWVYARRNGPGSFLRLGISEGQVLLQKSDPGGETRQMAARTAANRPMKLTLRVIGARALALLDGEPLTDRPVGLPVDLTEGPVSLAVWNSDGKAAARVGHVDIQPLTRRFAMVQAEPGQAEFSALRAQADDLWAVSPTLFHWRPGRATPSAAPDPSLEMFVHFHRIELLPAVSIGALPSGAAWNQLAESLLGWADKPGFSGINMVVDRVQPQDVGRIEALRRSMTARGKTLVVTARHLPGISPEKRHGWLAGQEPPPAGFHLASLKTRRHLE